MKFTKRKHTRERILARKLLSFAIDRIAADPERIVNSHVVRPKAIGREATAKARHALR